MTTTTPHILAYVGLGCNLGGCPATLSKARKAMAALPGLRLVGESGLYRTEPQDEPDQPWFVNQVVALSYDDSWTAPRLLAELQRIEAELGRRRDPAGAGRFGPRKIDLDLLLFGRAVLQTPELTLPHPRMRRRAFVLVPLAELAPDLAFPDGETVAEALGKIAFQAHGNVIVQPVDR